MLITRLRAVCTALVAAALTLAICPWTSARGADTKPITAVVDQLLDAWNKRDAPKFAAALTDDGDFINPQGGRVRGRKAIADTVGQILKHSKAGDHASRVDAAVKMVKPDVALLLSNLKLNSGDGKSANSLATLVLINIGGKWRISAMEVAQGAAPAGKK